MILTVVSTHQRSKDEPEERSLDALRALRWAGDAPSV
jgi:hypothetical protein